MKFRKGDQVAIFGTIQSDHYSGDTIRVKLDGIYSDVFAPVSGLKMVRPHYEAGDEVVGLGGRIGTVIMRKDDHLWIDFGEEAPQTYHVSVVERFDPPVSPEVADVQPEPPPAESVEGATDE